MRDNLGLFLAKRARLSPRLEALVEVERGRRFAYADLDRRANRAANAFAARGVRPGDRVALLLMNGVEFLESFFGLAKLGAVVVPLNWRLVADELAFILEDSGSIALVHGPEFAAAAAALRGRATPVRDVWRVGGAAPGALDYEALCKAASPEPPPCPAGPDDLLFIMYTSGTTGLPK